MVFSPGFLIKKDIDYGKKHTEPELIQLWKQGNDWVFETIYNQQVMQLLRIANSKTGNTAVAEELVQDTFLSLYKHRYDLQPDTNLSAYLYTALKNNILNYYRKESTHKRYEAYVQTHSSEGEKTTESAINTRELEISLIEEIEKLPPQCKTVFKLSRHDGLTDKEIAARLEISLNTVEQHKRKALRILRAAFKNY